MILRETPAKERKQKEFHRRRNRKDTENREQQQQQDEQQQWHCHGWKRIQQEENKGADNNDNNDNNNTPTMKTSLPNANANANTSLEEMVDQMEQQLDYEIADTLVSKEFQGNKHNGQQSMVENNSVTHNNNNNNNKKSNSANPRNENDNENENECLHNAQNSRENSNGINDLPKPGREENTIDIPSEDYGSYCYAPEDIDKNLNEIPQDSLYTTVIIVTRVRGIEFGVLFAGTVIAIQALCILVLALVKRPDEEEMDFDHRDWAVITALLLFVNACFAQFFEEILLQFVVLFQMDTCYVVGKFSAEWLQFKLEFNKNAVQYNMNKCFAFCVSLLVIETLLWLGVLVVGSRLLLQATSLQEIILDTLSAVFVLEVAELMERMFKAIGGVFKDNKYYTTKEVDLRPFPVIKDVPLYMFWMTPVVPGILVAVLFKLPYW